MKVVFAARRLNPGQYEAFRKAWEPPEGFPEGFARAYIVRDMNDPDVVITFGLFEVSDERADQLRTELEPSERARHEAMAPYVAETLVTGLYDVVHERGGLRDRGAHDRAPHRARAPAGRAGRLHGRGQGRGRRRHAAGAGALHRDVRDRPPRAPDPARHLPHRRSRGDAREQPGRPQQMLDAIAPHVESTGIDSTFQMVEELTPAHA